MSDDWKVQVSPKTPAGTLINIRGNSVEEVQILVREAHDLALEVIGLEQAFAGVHNVAPLSTGPSTGTQASQDFSNGGFPSTPPVSTPVVAPQAATAGPTCMHGARKYVQSKPGAAKQWAMWACPTVKDAPDKCAPQWA